MADLNARDGKLVQYLNEAYGNEKQLETALEAHIAMTTRKPYKKRLQEHLRETKRHARDVERRIKKLGGQAEVGPISSGPAAGAANVVQTAAQKAAALAQGPLHMVRGTGEQEKMLKNAKTERWNEAEEIATYAAIETFADEVGDRDTVRLVRSIRRDEERMAKFLDRLIPQLTKAVVKDEVPRDLRPTPKRRSGGRSSGSKRSTAAASSNSKGGAARSAASKRGAASTERSTGSASSRRSSGRSTARGKGSTTRRSGSGSARSTRGSGSSRSRSSSRRRRS